MRPQGDITQAMLGAWQQGPATVTQAAHLACVGLGAARYTASRMVARGQLAVLDAARPAVLVLPAAQLTPVDAAQEAAAAAVRLHRGFWGCV